MAVSAEVIATLVFGILMALFALGAMVQAAIYAARACRGELKHCIEKTIWLIKSVDEGPSNHRKDSFELE